jgi:proteasome accessory factor A
LASRTKVRLATGREMTALEIQREYFERASEFVTRRGRDPVTDRVLDLWGRTLQAIDTGDYALVAREIDWVAKWSLMERYMAKHDLPLNSPRIAHLDLAYHDVSRNRGLYYQLERKGLMQRVSTDLNIFEAKSVPPQTTRARLRGDFIKAAQERRRDFTVDWVHLKLNDQAQRTVLCKDPFRSHDERVDKLIASM